MLITTTVEGLILARNPARCSLMFLPSVDFPHSHTAQPSVGAPGMTVNW